MKKTWKEVQVSKCIKFGNKYRVLKPFMILVIVFIVAIDRIRIGILSNRKKLLGVGISFLVFLVSNSFSTPAFQYQAVVNYEEGMNERKHLSEKLKIGHTWPKNGHGSDFSLKSMVTKNRTRL